MPPRLIINADDFGLTQGINCAISELHQAGVLSSATMMATGPAFEHAVSIAKVLPTLRVGCHVVLVDGTPVSPLDQISTLLGPNRTHFRASPTHFTRDLLLGRINEDEIAHEALAQIEKLKQAGVNVTHIDTHKHTHIFPQVLRPLIKLLDRFPTLGIRNPFESASTRRLSGTSFMRRAQLSILNRFKPQFDRLTVHTLTTNGSLGIAATGHLDQITLRNLVTNLPENSLLELVCHPGYNDTDLDETTTRLRAHREIERQALLSVIPEILSLPQAPELIHYGDLTQ